MSEPTQVNCPACESRASTGYSAKGFFGVQGWVTDCTECENGPRVTRFTRDESITAWNDLVARRVADQQAASTLSLQP